MSNGLDKKKSEYLLELALEEQLAHDADLEMFCAEKDQEHPHIFSEEHERKMKRIARLAKRAENKTIRRKKILHFAAGFAAVICVSGFTVMNVEAFRIPFVAFLMDAKDEYTLFFEKKGRARAVTKNLKEYEPTYIPDGFNVNSLTETPNSFKVSYLDNKLAWFDICFYKNAQPLSVDTEDASSKKLNIDGNQAIFVEKSDRVHFIMYKDTYQYYLSGNISVEESLKILESLN